MQLKKTQQHDEMKKNSRNGTIRSNTQNNYNLYSSLLF